MKIINTKREIKEISLVSIQLIIENLCNEITSKDILLDDFSNIGISEQDIIRIKKLFFFCQKNICREEIYFSLHELITLRAILYFYLYNTEERVECKLIKESINNISNAIISEKINIFFSYSDLLIIEYLFYFLYFDMGEEDFRDRICEIRIAEILLRRIKRHPTNSGFELYLTYFDLSIINSVLSEFNYCCSKEIFFRNNSKVLEPDFNKLYKYFLKNIKNNIGIVNHSILKKSKYKNTLFGSLSVLD